jgi:hypothetical protein
MAQSDTTLIAVEDLNTIFFATAKQLIAKDLEGARILLGLDSETIEVIISMSPSQLIAVCRSGVPQYKLNITAGSLKNAVEAATHGSHASNAMLYLSRPQ